MKSSIPLLAVSAASFAAAVKDPVTGKDYVGVSDLPIRSNQGHTHVQFPIECNGCFRSDRHNKKEVPSDGYLEFDFRMSREWGIDGDDAAIVNGFAKLEEDFPYTDNDERHRMNIASAYMLFCKPVLNEHGNPTSVGCNPTLRGSIEMKTIFKNETHDIKGVTYNINHVESKPSQPAGFRLSYMRSPKPHVLRIQQSALDTEEPFANLDEWISPPAHMRLANLAHAPIDVSHDTYADFDPYWIECKTLPCHVNKFYAKVIKSYQECAQRKAYPERFVMEDNPMPLHCRIYTAPSWIVSNAVWLYLGIVFVVIAFTTTKQTVKKEKDTLKSRHFDKAEDDAVDFMMRYQDDTARFDINEKQ
ncbi:hypothetical protein K490DRAFT_60962 [Saccharata proteae CBS 121410]|uniref:DUF1996 domain-containing protein n=1 Tax=Saccharata proteae CBS 121410 TaxID=1314787 RepID=A0A9P4I1X9_9PEZI|nr:hypothetical protein K490DRAFT_60962 [Saccharata proteae CBS 121410]